MDALDLAGIAGMVAWIAAYYRWVDMPLRRAVGRVFGVEIRRWRVNWYTDAPMWKRAPLFAVELLVRFAVVLIPILALIFVEAQLKSK